MNLGDRGLKLIKQYEGFRQVAYFCPAKKLTIGYGTVVTDEVKKVLGSRKVIDEAFAEKLLLDHCQGINQDLRKYLGEKYEDLTQGQYDALVSFVYNLGITNFSSSTLLKKLLAGDIKSAANQFDRWVYARGIRLQGLVNRRAAEKILFLG